MNISQLLQDVEAPIEALECKIERFCPSLGTQVALMMFENTKTQAFIDFSVEVNPTTKTMAIFTSDVFVVGYAIPFEGRMRLLTPTEADEVEFKQVQRFLSKHHELWIVALTDATKTYRQSLH